MNTTTQRLTDSLGERYRIERELGQGGMATVYLAEDVRHHRKVAIKVLHAELSAVLGPDRFLKEIELTANLQHPHILPLFDSGAADGLLYYVMPYVEGETLRGRLERERQLPVDDAIRIAADVADALDYAHRRHVVHRDIKPENILLVDGRPVVADFGIALAVEQAGGSRMTQTGMSLGTPQYMAPEQAMGDKSVDHRADIYALGAVVYEMLSGEPPFTGPNTQAIVARVITEKPRSLTALRSTVSADVDAAVYSALQKLPADRPATAREFARMLTERRSPFEFVPAQRINSTSLAAGAVMTALLFGIAGYALGYHTHGFTPSEEPPSRLAMLAPNLGGTGPAALHRQIAMTADGSAVVYVAQGESANNILAYQRLDAESPSAISGSDGMVDPTISADGKTIYGFWPASMRGGASRNVRLPLGGGQQVEIPADINTRYLQVSRDGSLLYASLDPNTGVTGSRESVFRKIDRDGKVVSLRGGSRGVRFQQFLSDGRRAVVVNARMGTAAGTASVIDTRDSTSHTITNDQTVEIRIVAGLAVYVTNDGSLWSAPFDEKRGVFSAPKVKIASGVSTTGSGIAQFAVSDNGNVAYIPEEPRWLVLVDRDGRLRNATSERRNYHSPRFSPDGSRISVDLSSESGRDVWILSPSQGTISRATFAGDGHDAEWTSDGRYIRYTSFKSGVLGIFQTRPGGGGPSDSLIADASLGYTGEAITGEHRLITVLNATSQGSGLDIGFIDNDGRGPIRPVLADQFQTLYPAVSPDGKWLAYTSDKSGAQEIYVRPLAGDGDDVQISQNGGTEALWSRDGTEIYYRGGTEHGVDMMAASVRLSPRVEVTARRTLFPANDIVAAVPHANYDLSPDGRTFVMVRRSPATRIVVIQNLPALVKSMRSSAR
jgi:eukaryotic-like serine/threonine-protein kinase